MNTKFHPASRAFIVSGRLDDVTDEGRFRLLVNHDSPLFGRLAGGVPRIEALRFLVGGRVTVQGMVHFDADGQPRMIEALKIRRHAEGDDIFEEMPWADVQENPVLTPAQEQRAKSFDLMALWGTWPGDEPIEELLAQLD